MKHISESIIGKRGGRSFVAKDLKPGDILVKRNGLVWYYTGKNFDAYEYGEKKPEPSIVRDKFFQYTDENTFKDTMGMTGRGEYVQYDIVKIYRSGNFIKSVNYNSIEDFIGNNKPIWVFN